jgi:preprotein translocase subunit SecD
LRKAILAVAAVLAASALALFVLASFNPSALGPRLPDWVMRWSSVEGGPQFVLEVDSEALRRRGHEMLRDSVRQELRELRIGLVSAPSIRDGIVEVRVRDADRQRALERLGTLFDQRDWLDIREGDGGLILISYTEARQAERLRQATELSARTIESRLSSLGGFRVAARPQADGRIVVQVSRTDDLPRLIELATRPGVLEFRMVSTAMTSAQAIASRPPPDSEILYGSQSDGKLAYLIEKRVVVSGADLTDAQPGFDSRTNEPIVAFRFNASGARRFAQATADNVGQPFAIVLDNEVVSAPVIREPILGGSGQISGNFTVRSANDLAILLRAGALPARLKLIEELPAAPPPR